MPNWCDTSIEITHDDHKKLKEFYDTLQYSMSFDFKENGFGHSWLGNIVGNLELGTIDEDPKTDIRCRGSVEYINLSDGVIFIDTFTAWAPMLQVFLKAIEKYLPDAELTYVATEPGCELHLTNSSDFVGMWYLYTDEESYDEITTDDLVSILQNLLDSKETNPEVLIAKCYEADCFLSCGQCEFCEAWDCY